jgi:hypothetical protein
MSETLDGITGNDALKYECRDELVKDVVIKMTGVARSKTNPLCLVLLQTDWSASVNQPAPVPAVQAEPVFETKLVAAQRVLKELEDASASTFAKFGNDGGWSQSITQQRELVARLEQEVIQ